MSLFDRRRLALGLCAAPLVLAACNFQPVYGPGGAGNQIRDQISVDAPDTRLEFQLVARLEDRIGIGSTYTLSYTLNTREANRAISGAENIERINVNGTLNFTLRQAGDGPVVQRGSVSTFTAFATTASPVATASARRDAEDRLAVALADLLITQLILDAPTWP